MICCECLMRWRTAALAATGAEPDIGEALSSGKAPASPAITMITGTALCLTHFMECVQPQIQSGLVGANGNPLLRMPSANGART